MVYSINRQVLSKCVKYIIALITIVMAISVMLSAMPYSADACKSTEIPTIKDADTQINKMDIFTIAPALACTGKPEKENVPDVKITNASISSSAGTASFSFQAVYDENDSTASGFNCRLKGTKIVYNDNCKSPQKYEDLSGGNYTFEVYAYVEYNGGGASGNITSYSFGIDYKAPTVSSYPYISPSSPTVGNELTCNKGSWTNSPTNYSYNWYRDGNYISTDPASNKYKTTTADDNKKITCKVTASNSGGSGSATSEPVTPKMAVPANSKVPSITPTNPSVGDTLTCDKGEWTNSPTSYSYQWQRNGSDISGVTTSTYKTTTADEQKPITCKVTASNSGGSGTATSTTVTPKTAVPANSKAPSITPPNPSVGDTLTCDKGEWTNSPTSYSYQWQRNGSDISGVTTSTYKTTTADEQKPITCKVTASNSGGSGSATSAAVTPFMATPANSTAPSITPTNPSVGDTLTCDKGEWTNTTSYSYRWERSGSGISGATTSTYMTTTADDSKQITCKVTGSNSGGAGTISVTVSSNSVTPKMPAPANIEPPTISPADPEVGDTLTCNKGSWENSPTSYAYQWIREGKDISGATSSTYVATTADLGKQIYCEEIVYNSGSGASAISDPVTPEMPTIIQEPTNIKAPWISPVKPSVGDTLTCHRGLWSNIPTSYSYRWNRNGNTITSETGSKYTTTSNDEYKSITCIVTAGNSEGTSTVESAAVMPIGYTMRTTNVSSSGSDGIPQLGSSGDGTPVLSGLSLNLIKAKVSMLSKKKLKLRFSVSKDARILIDLRKQEKRCKKARSGDKKPRCEKKEKQIAHFVSDAKAGNNSVQIPVKAIRKLKAGKYLIKATMADGRSANSRPHSLKLRVLHA